MTTKTTTTMKNTGNQIVISVYDGHSEVVPVMRNGKPTKRTKEIWVHGHKDVTASGYIVEGHEVFISDEELNEVLEGKSYRSVVTLYRKDGHAVIAICKFGRTGMADHREVVEFNPKTEQIYIRSTGYNGATGRGWGASVKRIEWD